MSKFSLSDADLLDRFSRSRDEDAFGELVRRHVGWVHSVATRLTYSDAFGAEEVTQDVFTDLARKSSQLAREIRGGKALVGWLHMGARLSASNHRRATSRRMARESHVREQDPSAFMKLDDANNAEWDDIRPLIDEALGELLPPDRDAVLMRFFEERDLRSIGSAIGVSEEAARKRIDRALDRLRDWMESRGLRTTAAALGIAMATYGAQLPPAGLTERISQHALMKSGGMAAATNSSWVTVAVGTAFIGLIAWVAFQRLVSPSVPVEAEGAVESTVPTAKATQTKPSVLETTSSTSKRSIISSIVRIPKSFLEKIPIMSVTMTNMSDRRFVLTQRFIALYRLTPSEVDAVVGTFDKALHRYRTIEGQRLTPTTQPTTDPIQSLVPKNLPGFQLKVLETRNFVLEPFPAEAKMIHEELSSSIVSILGPERGSALLRKGDALEGEMRKFETTKVVNGHTVHLSKDVYYTYRLVELEQGPIVDLQRFSSPGNGSGAPYGEELYPYVPRELKADLTRWQDYIQQKGRRYFQWAAESEGGRAEPEMQSPDDALNLGGWDENSTTLELPRAWLTSLEVAGLTVDEAISEEAIELCELTEPETAAVTKIYQQMRERFLEMEKRHFQRSSSNSLEFVLHAFPQENSSLRAEFSQSLRGLLGDERGETLVGLVRTPISFRKVSELIQKSMFTQEHHELLERIHEKRWMERGDHEIHFKLQGNERGLTLEYRSPTDPATGGSATLN